MRRTALANCHCSCWSDSNWNVLRTRRRVSPGAGLLWLRLGEFWWAREDLHLQGSQTLDLWGLLFPLNHSPKNGNWILQSMLPRQNCFTKEIRRLLHGGKWSQSRVLPSAELAYETGLSAGSIAVLAHGYQILEPSLGVDFPSPTS